MNHKITLWVAIQGQHNMKNKDKGSEMGQFARKANFPSQNQTSRLGFNIDLP
jgi:hypothetical protein